MSTEPTKGELTIGLTLHYSIRYDMFCESIKSLYKSLAIMPLGRIIHIIFFFDMYPLEPTPNKLEKIL